MAKKLPFWRVSFWSCAREKLLLCLAPQRPRLSTISEATDAGNLPLFMAATAVMLVVMADRLVWWPLYRIARINIELCHEPIIGSLIREGRLRMIARSRWSRA